MTPSPVSPRHLPPVPSWVVRKPLSRTRHTARRAPKPRLTEGRHSLTPPPPSASHPQAREAGERELQRVQREAEARLAQAAERARQKEAEREAQTEERRRLAQARQVHIAQARDRVRESEAERVERMLRKEVLAGRRLEERRAREASHLERQKLVDQEHRAQRQAAVDRAKEASNARTRALVLARNQREETLWHNMEVQSHVKKQRHVQSQMRQSDARERVRKVKEEALRAQEELAAKIQKKAEWVASLEHQKAQAYEEL